MRKGLVALITALALAGCDTTSEKPKIINNITNNYYTMPQSTTPYQPDIQIPTPQPIVTATLEPLRPSPYQSELARYIQCAAQMIGENAGSDYQTINGYLENRFHLNLNNFQNTESLFNKLRNNVNNDNAGLLFAFQICTGYEHGEYNKAYYENQLRIWQSTRNNTFVQQQLPSSSRLVGYGNRTEADVEREKEFFRRRNAFSQYQLERDYFIYEQQRERDFFRDQQSRTFRRFGE